MRRFLSIMMMLVFFAGSASVAFAQASPVGNVSGQVTDNAGRPLPNARVTLRGPSTYTTATDARGAYAFAAVATGSYLLTIDKGGYQTASQSNIVVGTNPVRVDIALVSASFSSLRTIGNVRVSRGGTFNTTAAAVNVVTSATIAEQNPLQVNQILNEIPGVQISFPGSSANGAAPGAITVPNIRNGLSYETASLIDGHPVSVGEYGDYVTTFLSPALFQDIEVIKGPGATAPSVNNAINGTVNFRTKDPTATPSTFYSAGVTNTSGGFYNFGVSDTLGRLGFVVGIAGHDEISALNGAGVYFDPGTGSGDINGKNTYPYGCNGIGGGSATPLLGTNGSQFYSRVYNGCSAVASTAVSAQFDTIAELFKLRYKIGDRTFITGSYFGSQSSANQSGNTANVIQSIFQPGAGYNGPLKAGSQIDVLSAAYDAQPQFETNNEPIFQLELGTGWANDTLLARFYHATISRIQSAGYPNPFVPYNQNTNIYGTLSAFPGQAFNGQQTTIAQYNYFNDPELDKLTGYTLEYTHPVTESNILTVSGDFNASSSVDYYNDISYGGNGCSVGTVPGGYCYNTLVDLPQGSGRNITTLLLRDVATFTPKFTGTFALYQNYYHSTYPTNCENATTAVTYNTIECLPNGTLNTYDNTGTLLSNAPVNFMSTTHAHADPRMGLEWRPKSDVAVRFAAGSSIAPPYLYVLSQPNGVITPPSQTYPGAFATKTINSGNLQPETAFGYNLGADYRFKDNITVASGDVYLTNLFGQFLDESYLDGLCPKSAGCTPGTPLLVSQYINLSNARYEGIELTLKHIPDQGFGFALEGSTQKGYPYDLPPNFYCGFNVKVTACVPANYNTNLNIISGVNYQGEYINNSGSTTAGVDNQSVPYLQGNAEISYHLRNGAFALFGETLYGKNNSLNRPPFGVAYAGVAYPINSLVTVRVTGYNIFNQYSGLFPIYGAGVTVPLTNGQQAGTIGNVLGPARFTFSLTKTIDPEAANSGLPTPAPSAPQ